MSAELELSVGDWITWGTGRSGYRIADGDCDETLDLVDGFVIADGTPLPCSQTLSLSVEKAGSIRKIDPPPTEDDDTGDNTLTDFFAAAADSARLVIRAAELAAELQTILNEINATKDKTS